MKKYTLILSVFIFAFMLFGFNLNSANAMPNQGPSLNLNASDCVITSTLRMGSTGNEVACLQAHLGLTADGKFGRKTKAAVVAWQKSKGVKADGILGAKSRNILLGTNTSVVANTLNVKTYSSSKYGFSIEYPATAQIYDVDMTGGRNISFQNTPQNIFMVEVTNQICNDFDSGAVTSNVNINGIDFIKGDVSRYLSGMNSATSATEYCVVKNGTSYKLIPRITYEKGNQIDVNNDTVLNKMLSTFKFLTTN
jgi:peptidoglycan hydrolase-like protein with peptidoglycan-binding domain